MTALAFSPWFWLLIAVGLIVALVVLLYGVTMGGRDEDPDAPFEAELREDLLRRYRDEEDPDA